MLDALLVAAVAIGAAPVDQTRDPERAARTAARRYERLRYRRAPERYGGGSGERCDEVIGRFCFHFGDEGHPSPPEPEAPEVRAARRLAVRSYRRWLSRQPAEGEAAGGLVRYLLDDDRPGEAVSVARTHAWAAPGPESLLLLGLSLHAAGDFVAAEMAFDRARTLASPAERAALDDVGVLLAHEERERYDRLGPSERAAYDRRFWAYSDPSPSVLGNERRSAHFARHAWIRILEDGPRLSGAGMLSWGTDHEEILLRYGLAHRLERIRAPPYRLQWDPRVVSLYDPRAVSFVPRALMVEGVPGQPAPGDAAPLERDTVRSSYAPVGVRRTRGLLAQVTRFPTREGWLLRVDALLPPDTASPAAPVSPEGLIVVMDTSGRPVARAPAVSEPRPDSTAVLRAEVAVPPGRYVYQVELSDDSTGLAGWMRYRIDLPDRALAVSDPVIAPGGGTAAPDRAGLTPFPTRVLAPDEAVMVYAEVRGLDRVDGVARYSVEWWLERAEERTALGRAVHWLGRTLGVVEESRPVRVRWEAGSRDRDPVAVTYELDLTGAETGRYRLGLTVRDRVSGREATSYRQVRLSPVPPWPPVPDGPGRS